MAAVASAQGRWPAARLRRSRGHSALAPDAARQAPASSSPTSPLVSAANRLSGIGAHGQETHPGSLSSLASAQRRGSLDARARRLIPASLKPALCLAEVKRGWLYVASPWAIHSSGRRVYARRRHPVVMASRSPSRRCNPLWRRELRAAAAKHKASTECATTEGSGRDRLAGRCSPESQIERLVARARGSAMASPGSITQ